MELEPGKRFGLRYVGARFSGARLPLDVLSDLPAFRDLLVAYAKDEWRSRHSGRRRVPKGFDQGISFDLVAIEEGSAVPKLLWNREIAQQSLPGFSEELDDIVDSSYRDIVALVEGVAADKYPKSLSSEHIRALNHFGSGLRDNERIEFLDDRRTDGNVVYLDNYRRKKLITHVRETYEARYQGIGHLVTNSADGYVMVNTPEHGDMKIFIPQEQIINEFDGSLKADVQLDLLLELDSSDKLRNVIDVFDIGLIDAEIGEDLMRRRNRLAELRKLQPGWNGDSGEVVNQAALETAERLLSRRPYMSSVFRIYPTIAGGVLFEFRTDDWDYSVECLPDGQIEMYGIEIDGVGEMDPHHFAALAGC